MMKNLLKTLDLPSCATMVLSSHMQTPWIELFGANWQPSCQLHSSTLNISSGRQESRPWNNGAGSSLLAQLLGCSSSLLSYVPACLKWYDGLKCALPGTGKALCFKTTLTLQRCFCHKDKNSLDGFCTLHKYASTRPVRLACSSLYSVVRTHKYVQVLMYIHTGEYLGGSFAHFLCAHCTDT